MIDTLKQGEILGNGGGRDVYRVDGLAVKIPAVYRKAVDTTKGYKDYSNANSRRKIAQSIVEVYVWRRCPGHLRYLLCPIVDIFYVRDIPIIYMPVVEILDKKGRSQDPGWRADVQEIEDMFGLKKGEMFSRRNTAKHEGRLVTVDYGYMTNKKTMESLPDKYFMRGETHEFYS